MAAAASRAAKRQAQARAAKEAREKVILVIGLVLLVGLALFEGPKTLKKLRTSGAAPPAPSLSTPGTPTTPISPRVTRDPAALRAFEAKDPFVRQVSDGGTPEARSQPAKAPVVRTSSFVAKDPFVQQVTEGDGSTVAGSGSAGAGGEGAGAPTANVTGRYIVVLASIPLPDGKAAAQRGAGHARALGIDSVSILDSSGYSTLRQGFWVVFAGPFSTLNDMLKALDAARAKGFVSAYSRRLGK